MKSPYLQNIDNKRKKFAVFKETQRVKGKDREKERARETQRQTERGKERERERERERLEAKLP